MSILSNIGSVLRSVIARRRVDRDLQREMDFHVEMETAANLRAGHSPEEARRLAVLSFGGRERFREEAREAAGGRFTEELLQDLRYAGRVFRRSPGFTATVVLTLALGIGATTVIFSVTDHVVLRSLPYRNADRLVNVRALSDQLASVTSTFPANAAHYLAWKRDCSVCEGMVALRAGERTLTVNGEPTRIGALRVSDDFFTLLGASAEVGRLFASGDDSPGNERLVVLSHAAWREHFSARRDIVGTTVTIDGSPSTVIGVLASDFRVPEGSDLGAMATIRERVAVFTPLALNAHERATAGEHDYSVIILLRPGATLDQLRTQLDGINRANVEQLTWPAERSKPDRVAVLPLRAQVVGSAQQPLLLLLGAVAAVLLIVCVNLANLLLARSNARRRESAVRVALGAGRGRIVRQALTETVALALIGGAVGILLSRWGLRILLALAPPNLPRASEIHIDARVLAVSLAISALVGLAFGLVPAIRFGNIPPGDAIKESTRGSTDGRRGAHVRSLLIASQVGLSTVLLVGAGLFLQSFLNVTRLDKGFTAERVLALDVALPMSSYRERDGRTQFFDEALRSLSGLPGVTATAATSQLPIEGEAWVDDIRAANAGSNRSYTANFRFVSATFFSTLDVPVKRGRAFTDADRGRPVVLLSERAAQALWPNENPIGKIVHADNNHPEVLAEVVGIAANVRTTGLESEGSLTVYRPYWEIGMPFMSILIRTAGDPQAIIPDARRAIRAVSAAVPISHVRTVADVVSGAVALRRFEMVLIGLFALTALLTASIGIYGIISHALARRTNEMAIRMALGAREVDVQRLVLGEAMRPVVVGVLGGALIAVGLGRAVRGLLFQVPAVEPWLLVLVTASLLGIALVASWLPARRASLAGPGALRVE